MQIAKQGIHAAKQAVTQHPARPAASAFSPKIE